MNTLIKVKNFIADFVISSSEYILALLLLLECYSVYTYTWGRNVQFFVLQQLLFNYGAFLAAGLLLRFKYKFSGLLKSLAVLIPAELILYFYYRNGMAGTPAEYDYIRCFFRFFPQMLLVFALMKESKEPYRLFYALADVVLVLAVASLVAWIHVEFLGWWDRFGKVSIAWGEEKPVVNAVNLGFFWSRDWTFVSDGSLLRNTGVYPESPMYNIVLNIALATELFLKRRTPVLRAAVLTLTIVSTIGSLGILIMLGAWGLKLIACIPDRKLARRTVLIGGAALILLAVVVMIRKENENPGSFYAHLSDYVGCFNAWKANPVFGVGWNREAMVAKYYDPPRLKMGISNSIAPMLAEGGLVLSGFYLLAFVFLWVAGGWKKARGTAPFALVVFALYCVSIFFTRFIMIALLAFGFAFAGSLVIKDKNAETPERLTGRKQFCLDKESLLLITGAVLATLFLIYTNILGKHGLLLEQDQWGFVEIVIYGLWGLGMIKTIVKTILNR